MWKKLTTLTFAILMCGGLQLAASGPDTGKAEEIIAKHVRARGGLEAWAAVKTMKLSGTFTGFSIPAPFVLYRARPNKIWWDHFVGDKKVLIGGEAGTYWWINGWYNPDKAVAQSPVDANVTMQEAEFATPFFDYHARGFKVDYAGEGALEGQRGLVLKLTRNNDKEETWYLDPDTYLEFGRVSRGSDFGTELEQTTFFSDFREVAGLQIPHLIETEFLIRHRVMEIDAIEINVAVDNELFALPFPANMKPFQQALGDWQVAAQFSSDPGQPFVDSETHATVTSIANGNLFVMEIKVPGFLGDTETYRTLSYDASAEHYLLTYFNDLSAHTRLMTGKLIDGTLTLENKTTETPWKAFGQTFYEKVEIGDIKDEGFTIKEYISNDNGETWANYLNLTFTRKKN